jgi:hypothetical protein
LFPDVGQATVERAAALFARTPVVVEPPFEYAEKDVEEIDTSVGRMLQVWGREGTQAALHGSVASHQRAVADGETCNQLGDVLAAPETREHSSFAATSILPRSCTN